MLLEKIKKALRLTHDKLDDELTDLIEIAKADLRISGIIQFNEDDYLIYQAIKTYIKAEYEPDTGKSEKLMQSYMRLKEHLSLCSEYREVVEEESDQGDETEVVKL